MGRPSSPPRWALPAALALAVGLAGVVLAGLAERPAVQIEPRVYLIGNSLTFDTEPRYLDIPAEWHIDCGDHLRYIHDRPDTPCKLNAAPWPEALRRGRYSALVVQPWLGTTLDENADIIAEWMAMQPDADVVVHTGWPKAADLGEAFASTATAGPMVHSASWLDALVAELRRRSPDRAVRRTRSLELLVRADRDAAAGRAPFDSVGALFRDHVHMDIYTGRYLHHHALRAALGRPPRAEWNNLAPDLRAYFDSLLTQELPS